MGTTIPDLNELRFFVEVSQRRSFTKAAQRLGVPKSTVSRAVRRLEQRLAVQLVERTTRRVSLTEVGELYLSHCRRVMEEAEGADLAVGALLGQPRGRLRVGVPIPFARAIAGPTLAAFLAKYPELQVQLLIVENDAAVHEGKVDLMIRAGALGESGLLVKPLMRILPWVVASPRYLEGRERPETPAELRRYVAIATSCDTVGSEAGATTTWRLRRGNELAEVQMEVRITAPDPEMNRQLALASAGVALLSRGMVRGDVEAGRLAQLLPDWEPEPVVVHALYPSRLGSSPKVRAFLEFLKDRLGSPARG
jgi:DNA-binding transcriptional LysR family regulator